MMGAAALAALLLSAPGGLAADRSNGGTDTRTRRQQQDSQDQRYNQDRQDRYGQDRSGQGQTREQKRYFLLMSARFSPYDPVFLLAMQQELGLTREQVNDLEELAEESREEASDVLNEQQIRQLRNLGVGPGSMERPGGRQGTGYGRGWRQENSGSDQGPGCRGMSGEDLRRCQMLHRIMVSGYSPQFLLAAADELGLTSSQVDELKDISQSTRDEARGVLTRSQVRWIRTNIGIGPFSVLELHKRSMQAGAGNSGRSSGRHGTDGTQGWERYQRQQDGQEQNGGDNNRSMNGNGGYR